MAKGKRGSMATVSKDFENGSATWTFSTGETRTVGTGDLDSSVVNQLALHGLIQKCSDSYAGKDAGEAVANFDKVVAALASGEFNAGRARVGERVEPLDVLAGAVFSVYQAAGKPVTLEKVRSTIEAMEPAAKRKLRTVPEVAIELAKLKKSDASLDSLMGV